MPDQHQKDDKYQPPWNELVTLHEAAMLSGLSQNHLRHLVSEGEIWGKKLGRDWFTTEHAVKKYLARDRRPGPKPKSEN